MNVRPALIATAAVLAIAAIPVAFAMGDMAIVASGKVRQESRSVTAFTAVGLTLPGKVELRQGSPEAVTVEADDNLLPEIETVVENGKLKIRFARNISVVGRSHILVTVTAPRFDSIAVAGSGDVVSAGLASPALSVSVSGSGDVKLENVQVDTLKASIAGSGDIRATGKAGEVTAKIAGSGGFHGSKLEAARANVSIAGSGDVTVGAAETLNVSIAGSGDVRYHGDPKITRSVAGSGQIMRAGSAS